MAPDAPPSRPLVSLAIVVWLVGSGASLAKKTAVGKAIRTVTGPIERLLGVWQAWGMFGPNPPMGTSWVRVSGEDAAGNPVPVAPLVGELPGSGVRGLYERPVKLERNMLDAKNVRLRKSFAAWRCAQARAAGSDLAVVHMGKESFRTLRPSKLRASPRPVQRVVWTEFESVWCSRESR